MAETPYRSLSADDRRDALRVAEAGSAHRAFLLEKDIWVVATLHALFEAPFGKDLAFKGGTSLSKAYRAIRRFSEDVDITYDIRAFAPDLVADAGAEALPHTRSQERRWTKAIRARLDAWAIDEAAPSVETNLQRDGFEPRVRAEAECLHIVYEPLFDDYAFVRPEVTVEFGARSTGEPRVIRPVPGGGRAAPEVHRCRDRPAGARTDPPPRRAPEHATPCPRSPRSSLDPVAGRGRHSWLARSPTRPAARSSPWSTAASPS